MKLRWLGVLAVLVAFGAGAWVLLRPPEYAPLPAATTTLPAEAPVTRVAPESTKL